MEDFYNTMYKWIFETASQGVYRHILSTREYRNESLVLWFLLRYDGRYLITDITGVFTGDEYIWHMLALQKRNLRASVLDTFQRCS